MPEGAFLLVLRSARHQPSPRLPNFTQLSIFGVCRGKNKFATEFFCKLLAIERQFCIGPRASALSRQHAQPFTNCSSVGADFIGENAGQKWASPAWFRPIRLTANDLPTGPADPGTQNDCAPAAPSCVLAATCFLRP